MSAPEERLRAQLGALTSDHVAALDAAAHDCGVSTLQLMEIAGWQVARCVWQRVGTRSSILVVAGHGNNGGDGLVAARHLATWGCYVSAHVLSEESALGDLLAGHVRAARDNGVTVMITPDPTSVGDEAGHASLVIDAMLGTGLRTPPHEPLATAIRAVNESDRAIVSIDVPSGLDATSGEAHDPCVWATSTCTLTAMKAGLWTDSGRKHAGETWVADIGMPVAAWQRCGLVQPQAIVGGVLVPISTATP